MENTEKTGCIMIIPGNGCSPVKEANWYLWLFNELSQVFPEFDVILKDMPDPNKAREIYWIPFIVSAIKPYAKRYIIGHSSGAVASMRLLENTYVDGVFLVSGCVSDLGHKSERISGYYPQQMDGSVREWRWDLMRKNSGFIVHVGSQDDEFIPIEEMREIRDKLGLEKDCYVEFEKGKGMGHFMREKFEELKEIVVEKLKKQEKIMSKI